MTDRNRVDEAVARAKKIVPQRMKELEERKGIVPQGQKKPSPEELREAVDTMYPLIDFVTEDGRIIEKISPLVLFVMTFQDRVEDSKQFLKDYAKGVQ